MKYNIACRRAEVKSKEGNCKYYVISIDHAEDRTYTICNEDYIYEDEFIAFNGKVEKEYFNG